MLSTYYSKIIELISGTKDYERFVFITTALEKKHGYVFGKDVDDTILSYILQIEQMDDQSLSPTAMKFMWKNGAVVKASEDFDGQYLHVTKSVRNLAVFYTGRFFIFISFLFFILSILKIFGV